MFVRLLSCPCLWPWFSTQLNLTRSLSESPSLGTLLGFDYLVTAPTGFVGKRKIFCNHRATNVQPFVLHLLLLFAKWTCSNLSGQGKER